MGLRARKKQEKIEAIKVAARALFAEHGYAATTTRAIAEGAGVAVGTVFVYFPEKRDILFAVMRADLDAAIAAAFDALPEHPDDLVDDLSRVFFAIFAVYERHGAELGRVFVKEQLFVDPQTAGELASWTLGFLARISERIIGAQQRGHVAADAPVMLAAMHCFSSYFFALATWLAGSIGARDRDLMLAQSLGLTMRGLMPRDV